MNIVCIIGRIGRQPEIKQVNNKSVCSFSVAINEGSNQEPIWIDVTAWEKTADNVAQYLGQGDECSITGRLRQERWEKDGEKRSKLSVVASQVDFLRKKGDAVGDGSQQQQEQRQSRPAAAPAPEPEDEQFDDIFG